MPNYHFLIGIQVNDGNFLFLSNYLSSPFLHHTTTITITIVSCILLQFFVYDTALRILKCLPLIDLKKSTDRCSHLENDSKTIRGTFNGTRLKDTTCSLNRINRQKYWYFFSFFLSLPIVQDLPPVVAFSLVF